MMSGKDVAVKKYVVRLSAEERAQLEGLIRKGKRPAGRLLKARILLKADVSEAGEGWSEALRLDWRENPSFPSSLRTVSALIGCPISVRVAASFSMLFDTQIKGRIGSP